MIHAIDGVYGLKIMVRNVDELLGGRVAHEIFPWQPVRMCTVKSKGDT